MTYVFITLVGFRTVQFVDLQWQANNNTFQSQQILSELPNSQAINNQSYSIFLGTRVGSFRFNTFKLNFGKFCIDIFFVRQMLYIYILLLMRFVIFKILIIFKLQINVPNTVSLYNCFLFFFFQKTYNGCYNRFNKEHK